MENKYFTPDIEDLHVGYEYEQGLVDSNWFTNGWEKRIINEESDLKLIKEYPSLHRVPYLTKEQIEAEGWKHSEKDCFNYNNRWMCSWYPEYNRMEFCDDENENGFAGECKDINTFRKIIKLLNIK